MTKSEFDTLKSFVTDRPWLASVRLKQYLAENPPKEAVAGQNEAHKGTWTDNQRKAFHKGCEELAAYLNERGLDMKAVLKDEVDIPWDKDNVKEYIFRPIMKAMWGYESHKQLKKVEQVSQLWNVAMKHLGERHSVEYMEFPHDRQKAEQEMGGYRTDTDKGDDYPQYHGQPSF